MPPRSLKKKKSRRIKAALPIHPQDLHALRSIFESTGGPFGWKVKVNWMTAAPLAEWTGVLVDEDTGRVKELWLRANGLTQAMPDALGLLSELQVLDLGENPGLGGPLPAALGNLLHLRLLMLDECQLDLPLANSPEPSLRYSNREEVLAIFKSIGGTIVAKDRPALAQLFLAWGGVHWLKQTNWCSSAPLGTWHGVTTDGGGHHGSPHGRVTKLYLGGNGLVGKLSDGSDGLQALHKLLKLSMFGNFLSGAWPQCLAMLPHLNYLDLEANDGLHYIAPSPLLALDSEAAGGQKNQSVAAPGAVKLECKTVDDLRDLLRALGLEDLYKREVAKEKKRERERQEKIDAAAAKARLEAESAAAALAEASAKAEADHAVHAAGVDGMKSNFLSLAKAKEDAQTALLNERPALLAFGDATGRRIHWRDSTGWDSKDSEAPNAAGSGKGGAGGHRGHHGSSATAASKGAAASPPQAEPVSEEWYGVTLEPRGSGRVGGLKLSANALTGNFAAAGDLLFPALSKLVLLDLRANALTGTLPSSIGSLRSLEELYLSLNFLEGQLPDDLGDCNRLKKCSLNGNRFSGPVPFGLARCSALHYLDLSCNPKLAVPKAANLECTSQVKIVKLFEDLGILKRRN